MPVGTGLQTYVMIGEESSFGVAVTPTAGLLHNSESMQPTEAMILSGSLFRRGIHSGSRAQGGISVGGSITFDPRYNWRAFSMLLKHAIGAVATSRPDITSNGLVFNHTFTPADLLPTGLTIEVAKGSGSTGTGAHRFSGCKITRLSLSGTADEVCSCTVDFMGKDQTFVATPTTLALLGGEGQLMVATDCALTWGGAAQGKVLAFEFSVENPLQEIRSIDSRTIQEPQRSGHQIFRGSWSAYIEGTDLQSDYRNKTIRELVLTIRSNVVISGTYEFQLAITMSKSELLETPFQNADNPGILQATVGYQAFLDEATANEVTCTLQNSHPVAS